MTRTNTSDNSWSLPIESLEEVLTDLSESCELWLPSPVGEGVRFRPFREGRPWDLAQTPPAHSVKAVLFPNPETLFTFHRDGHGVTVDPPDPDGRPLVAFGVRACDVRAIAALDAVFLNRGASDPTYRNRRERLCLVGLACQAPAPTCFCDWMGSSPSDPTGMDIQIVPQEGRYIFRILTERGEECLSPVRDRFTAAGDTAPTGGAGVGRSGARVDFAALKEAVKNGRDDPYWHALADACLGCGICTFLCPVCSCFTLTDEGTLRGGRRIRAWDACMFPSFTKEASGHNPRGDPLSRVKQRFFHKFYYSVANGEPPGCVGCGRCVAQCPAAIDIRAIIRHFQPEVS